MTAERSKSEIAILDAALDLVTEVGFDCVSMDAVATRARASKATIYRHWAGKAELVADAVQCRACPDTVPVDCGSLREDLLATVEVLGDAMAGADGNLMLGLIQAMQRDQQLATSLREQLHDAKRPIWLAICQRAAERGEVADADRAADLLGQVAPAMTLLQRWVLGLPLDEAWQLRVVDDVLLPLLTNP